ncbi:MAG: lipoyl(octanoyl) transferase LipB [Bacteroidota bacterium]
MEKVLYQDLSPIDYQEAWDLQEKLLRANVEIKLAAGRKADPLSLPTQHHLLFCEHPPVYTLGKSGKEEHLLVDAGERSRLGISYYKINRGGDITYHGPGQITGYPIFDLEKFRTDIGWYLRSMEEVMIRLLADYGLEGMRSKGETGVWLDVGKENARKICAMGVRCSRWITMHGFALNVNTDLQYFSYIVPCGIADKGVTSLAAELNGPLSIQEVKSRLKGHFADVFGLDY